MNIKSKYIEPKFKKESNPKIGLLALSTDLTIESDFQSICHSLPIDLFVNRIHNENPLTKENLLKMYAQIESITEKILPEEKISTVAYACTSGTIAIGEDKVKENTNKAAPKIDINFFIILSFYKFAYSIRFSAFPFIYIEVQT